MSQVYFEVIPKDILYEIFLQTKPEDLRGLCANELFQKICSNPRYQMNYIKLNAPELKTFEDILWWGVEIGSAEYVEGVLLVNRLRKDVYVNIDQYRNKKSPLIVASEKGYDDIVRLLLEEGAHRLQIWTGMDAMFAALRKGHQHIFQLLLDYGIDPNISLAARGDNQDIVLLLLYNGINPDVLDRYGETPLHAAVHQENTNMVRLLLSFNVDPNITDWKNKTPLITAVENGLEEMVHLLLEADADFDSQDNDGKTALMYAVINGDDNLTRLLLEAGADVTLINEDDETALDLARAGNQDNIVRLIESFTSPI